jgi:hypothetical protein
MHVHSVHAIVAMEAHAQAPAQNHPSFRRVKIRKK